MWGRGLCQASSKVNDFENEFSNEVLNNMHNKLNEFSSYDENDKMDIDNWASLKKLNK